MGNEIIGAIIEGDGAEGCGSALNYDSNLSNDKLENDLSNNVLVVKGDGVGGLSNDELGNNLTNNFRLL